MSDRGSCKVFSPNVFNPTKCQNCFKPKEGHPSGPVTQPGGKMQRGISLANTREKNVSAVKTLLKEGFLSIGITNPNSSAIEDWVKRWYMLYSTGELEEFQVEDGQVMKEKPINVIILRDFIRLVDGATDVSEENSIGLKSLKDAIYLKAVNKVEFENWWKELSNFVPSQMKRAYSTSAANRTPSSSTKSWLNKTYSSPQSSTSRSPTVASPLSAPQESPDAAQVDVLNSKITRLQSEVNKIPKLEEEKRQLELEVNYWKEYVTNSNASRKSGKKSDIEKDLNEARIQVISLQDKLNETEKELKLTNLTISKQNKELDESRTNLEEANNMINVHKASINELKTQLAQRKEDKVDGPPIKPDIKSFYSLADERASGNLSPASDGSSERGEASDFETKFFNLREKMKRIEKELFLKSKELEKANESRSKVAKYTRTLLQELEAKLNDTQRKMLVASERLSDTTMELELEREKRRRLESERDQNALSRHSSVSSIVSNQEQGSLDGQSESAQVGEIEASNRYVEYYRSRFRESEASLLEKDKKLSEAETKNKELEGKYKNVLKQCRSLDEIQIKLSDATHKLSDRQLKIHELTREVEKLRGYERSYDRKSKELQLSTDKVKDLSEQVSELKNRLAVQDHDLEGFKIREVVMKERLSALEEESSDEDGDDEEDDESRLERSIEAKERVEKTVDLEGQVRLLEIEREQLNQRIKELEEEVMHFGKSKQVADSDDVTTLEQEAGKQSFEDEARKLRDKVKELEDRLIKEEDNFYSEISLLKDKHKDELEMIRGNTRHEMQQYSRLKEDYQNMRKEMEEKENERKSKMMEGEMGKEAMDTSSKLRINDLEKIVDEMKKELKSSNLKLNEFERMVQVKDEKLQSLVSSTEKLNSDLKKKSLLLEELTEKVEDGEDAVKAGKVNIQQLEKLHEDKNTLLKDLESENAKLRDELSTMSNQMFELSSNKYNVPGEEAAAVDKEREIMQGSELEMRTELTKARELLSQSQKTKSEYRNQLEETGRKYLESEEKVISLSQELISRTGMEKELSEEIITIQTRIESMKKQLNEAQESLQSKSIELEKDRNNFSHLVDVTSDYIKELENSLAESREKIDELENVVEESRINNGKRMPPDGISGKERDDSLSDQSDLENGVNDKELEMERDRLNFENEKLTARLSSLESELIAVKNTFQKEREELLKVYEKQKQSKDESCDLDTKDGIDSNQTLQDANRTNIEEPKSLKSFGEFDLELLQQRIKDLEIELEKSRKNHEEEMKIKDEEHLKSIAELKEEMEMAISETVKALNSSISNENTSDLEERIREIEKEKEELRIRYEDELEAEKEAHQIEMEETIRDMLTVTEVFKSGKYNEKEELEEGESCSSQKSSRKSSVMSSDGLEELRKDYEKKLAQKEKEWQKEIEMMKQNMSTVIDALHHGGASAAILELTNTNQVLRKEMNEAIADFDVERGDLKMKIEKLESNNFFGLRRNEEMGSKIFQMQSELEEMERKHKLELDVYQNKENSEAVHEVVKVNEMLEKKLKKLELELEESKERSLEEMELMAMKIQEEKRVAVSEMTDTVLNLEAIIDEMKEKHEIDIREFEARSREEKLEAIDRLQERIVDLEEVLVHSKEEYEEKLALQGKQHRKEIQELKEELEAKAEYYKAMCEERQEVMKSSDLDGDLQEKYDELQLRIEDSEKNLQGKIDALKAEHVQELTAKQKDFENQINEIRSEYEEKLKSCIKESARRQSVSSRKTESQKSKELNSKVMELEMALEEQQKEFQAEIDDYKQIIENFQALVSELRGGVENKTENEEVSETQPVAAINKGSSRKMEELENQIKGFEKRIEYYKRKAERDEESENSRVSELQQEVHGLREEMKELTDRHSQESIPGASSNPILRRRSETSEVYEEKAMNRERNKRWSDLHLTDMVFTSDGIKPKRSATERGSWKRWSDLHLKQDPKLLSQIKRDDVGKSGSVARRKKLWEQSDEHRKMQRPQSSIRP